MAKFSTPVPRSQIEVDGKSYDIRPDYASALARMARLAELDPRSADKARRLRSTFPGVDVPPHCDPRLFLCRALAALGSGQRRIAVHVLTEDPSERSLVTVLHPLTELDPTFLCLLGLHLVTSGIRHERLKDLFGLRVDNAGASRLAWNQQ